MRYTSFLSLFAGVLAATTAFAQSPLPPPQFTPLFNGQYTLSSRYNTTGPFGLRRYHMMDGGRMSNATTGEAAADILSFAYNGIVTESGLGFSTLTIPLVWSTDGHFALVSTSGVKNDSSGVPYSWHYAHVETDSPTYSWMNGKFFVVQLDSSSDPTARNFTIFEETS